MMPRYHPTVAVLASDVNAVTHHAPFGDQAARYEDNRKAVLGLMVLLRGNCPASPELETALNRLRECLMWSNASIACNEKEDKQ
jgi:hypothetical protein